MKTAPAKPQNLVAATVAALAIAERFVRLQGLAGEASKMGRLRKRWMNGVEPRERR